ncbi:hypothetical protein BaRGS_00008294, partial [Batillaria attramentaria]
TPVPDALPADRGEEMKILGRHYTHVTVGGGSGSWAQACGKKGGGEAEGVHACIACFQSQALTNARKEETGETRSTKQERV